MLTDDLQKVLDESIASEEETGVQLAVYQYGKLLCSLCAGYTGPDRKKKVDERTLFPVFSVGKGVMTVLMHQLREQGFYDYDDPVAKYWPEYGCNGKEDTRIWHVLTHRAGLYAFPDNTPFEDQYNWAKACALLAGMKPLSRIGGKHFYHAYTFGILTGRLAEGMTGKDLRTLLQENILDPLNIQDLFYGLPDRRFPDLAPIDGAPSMQEDPRCEMNRKESLTGLNPSANGCMNALSLAKIYASLLEDGMEGKRLLQRETVENATFVRRSPDDPVKPGEWSKFGLGWALCGPAEDFGRMFGHGGACGSEGFADKKTGLAVGFTKNKLNHTHPNHPTRNRISQVLGIPERIW